MQKRKTFDGRRWLDSIADREETQRDCRRGAKRWTIDCYLRVCGAAVPLLRDSGADTRTPSPRRFAASPPRQSQSKSAAKKRSGEPASAEEAQTQLSVKYYCIIAMVIKWNLVSFAAEWNRTAVPSVQPPLLPRLGDEIALRIDKRIYYN